MTTPLSTLERRKRLLGCDFYYPRYRFYSDRFYYDRLLDRLYDYKGDSYYYPYKYCDYWDYYDYRPLHSCEYCDPYHWRNYRYRDYKKYLY